MLCLLVYIGKIVFLLGIQALRVIQLLLIQIKKNAPRKDYVKVQPFCDPRNCTNPGS